MLYTLNNRTFNKIGKLWDKKDTPIEKEKHKNERETKCYLQKFEN